MWWRSAVNCPFFLRLAASRTRSSAWVTRTRLWVRCVLCWSAFPLVPGLGSAGSSASRPASFVGFVATMPESDFSGSCIGGSGSSPSRRGPCDPTGLMADPEISRFPRKERPYMPDPMGGGRRPALWQSEVATTHSGDGHACCSSSTRSAGRHPQRSWRNFRFVGTQPLNLADHFAVGLRRRKDVETRRRRRRHWSVARALFGVQAEGVCANREIFPDHRHSGGGIGRLLDSPRVAERRDRKPRRRSGLDCDLASAWAGENRSDRRRGASTRAAGL